MQESKFFKRRRNNRNSKRGRRRSTAGNGAKGKRGRKCGIKSEQEEIHLENGEKELNPLNQTQAR
jgi:hypothetical protein